MPPNTILSSVTTTNGSWTNLNRVVECSLGALPMGLDVVVRITLVPVNTQMITNEVWLSANETDPSPDDNRTGWNLTDVVPVASGPSMVLGRMNPLATTLVDGRVLITGGSTNQDYTGVSRTAELYHPQLETFTLTGPMSVARYGHTATLLTNGTVLVAGGAGLEGATTVLEVYDPTNEVFLPAGNFAVARLYPSATRLQDGRVLFAGGDLTNRMVEIFNPSDGSITSNGELKFPRFGHVAALLPDGKVLLAGGSPVDPYTAEIHDPITGVSVAVGSLVTNHLSLAAVALQDGRVLVFGGSSAELFDPATKQFSLAGPLLETRTGGCPARLNDGRVLISGGGNPMGFMASTEIFDPVTDTFTAGPPMTHTRIEHCAATLLDGRVLIAGGFGGVLLGSSELIAINLDADQDGMEDNWELAHGFSPTDRGDAILDADADGLSNLQEFLAGTDPHDPTSNMRITTVQLDDAKVRIAFTSVAGKRYAVERNVGLLNGSWELLTNGISGSGAVISVFDSSALAYSKAMYRVRLIP